MTKLSWRLAITDLDEWERTKEYYHCTKVECFFTLKDVWEYLGFKLKKERNGYAGIKGNTNYCLTRM